MYTVKSSNLGESKQQQHLQLFIILLYY